MISYFGFVLYIITAFAVIKVSAIKTMIEQAFILAPELSVGMFSLYAYPCILALALVLFRRKTYKHGALLKNQTTIAASVAVSLGLIGTFQGLTAMVNSIAGSMGGEGDITEKMGGMIDAIANALSAMSYAFLTSILGVAVSVLLILSLNLWMFGFEEEDEEKQNDAEDVNVMLLTTKLSLISDQNIQTAEKLSNLVSLEEKTESLVKVLESIVTTQQGLLDSNVQGCEILQKEIQSGYQHLAEVMNDNTSSIISSLDKLVENPTDIVDMTNKLSALNQEQVNELVKIADSCQKILSISMANNIKLKEFKEEIDAERMKLKKIFKVISE